MDRKIILNATARYIPTVIGSQVFAIGFAMLAGCITGFGPINGLFDVAAPCMSGGSAGAIATLPQLYSNLSGTDLMGEAGKIMRKGVQEDLTAEKRPTTSPDYRHQLEKCR